MGSGIVQVCSEFHQVTLVDTNEAAVTKCMKSISTVCRLNDLYSGYDIFEILTVRIWIASRRRSLLPLMKGSSLSRSASPISAPVTAPRRLLRMLIYLLKLLWKTLKYGALEFRLKRNSMKRILIHCSFLTLRSRKRSSSSWMPKRHRIPFLPRILPHSRSLPCPATASLNDVPSM